MSLYKGSAGKFTVTTTEEFEEMVVLIVNESGSHIVAKFAYPARTGFTTLVKEANTYSAIMTEAETLGAQKDAYYIEVKMFKADGTRPVSKARLNYIENSAIGKIGKS